MKKIFRIIIILLIILVSIFSLYKTFNKEKDKINLSDKYYGTPEINKINKEELRKIKTSKDSFILGIGGEHFIKELEKLSLNKNITILYIPKAKSKDLLLIYKKGKLKRILNVKDKSKLDNLFSKNIIERNIKINNLYYNYDLTKIEKEKGKVNIYFFYGEDCYYCSEEKKYLESLNEKVNIYFFEVWHDSNNKKKRDIFSNLLNEEVKSVPYTIIGDKSMLGFSEESKKTTLKMIEDALKNDKDIFFLK